MRPAQCVVHTLKQRGCKQKRIKKKPSARQKTGKAEEQENEPNQVRKTHYVVSNPSNALQFNPMMILCSKPDPMRVHATQKEPQRVAKMRKQRRKRRKCFPRRLIERWCRLVRRQDKIDKAVRHPHVKMSPVNHQARLSCNPCRHKNIPSQSSSPALAPFAKPAGLEYRWHSREDEDEEYAEERKPDVEKKSGGRGAMRQASAH